MASYFKQGLVALTCLGSMAAFSQKTAKTEAGEAFLVYHDGTWKQAPDPGHTIHFTAVLTAPGEKPVVAQHAYYTIGYSPLYHVPYWTYYHLDQSQVSHDTLGRSGSFTADPMVADAQANDNDYKGAGYDKGHMVPCEDMSFDETAMKETFYYTNCVPQTPKLNRGQWKNLEQLTRNWAIDNGSVEVYSGVIMSKGGPVLGATKVLIPQACYKIVLDDTGPDMKAIAFVMPNQEEALSDPQAYACSVDQVETLTGLDFFPELPDELEKKLEAAFDTNAWNWEISAHKPHAASHSTITAEPSVHHITVQCSAITQKGERCKRMTTSPNGKCARHGGN